MGGYGYRYESYSTYNTAGGGGIEEPFASLIKKPFGPFVPDSSNHNSESYVPRRKQVPVTTGSHANSSPTKAYPARDDDYEWHRRTSPVHGRPEFLTKIQNEASRPAGFNPATTDWRQRPHPTAYNNGANGYGDHGGSKEGYNPKPIVRSDSYDDYPRDDGYGGKNNFPKSKWPTDGYDNFNRDSGYGGNNYSNKEGQKPTVPKDGYDGYNRDNGGYGGKYGNKEGHKPIRDDSYDGYQPAVNYSEPKKATAGGGWPGSIWTAPPKQGTQLTSPTNDINMAIELLKEAANISGGPKAKANGYPNPNDKYDSFRGRNDGVDRPTTKESERVKPFATAAPPDTYRLNEPSSNVGKAMEPPVKEPERKNVMSAAPPQPRITIPLEYNNRGAAKPYVDSGAIDSKQAATKYKGRLL